MGNDEVIDVHHLKPQLEAAFKYLERNPGQLSARNVALIRSFCNDCLLGKTVLRKAKKRIGTGRVLKYMMLLYKLAYWLGEDFDRATQAQIEDLVRRLEGDQLVWPDAAGKLVRRTYSEESKHDVKVTLKKFYKWLLGDNVEYPALVRWIDTHVSEGQIPSLMLDEVERLVGYARTPRDKAIVMTLFETGARVGELLNVRLKHLEEQPNYLLLRITVSKTFGRSLPLYRSPPFLRDWLQQPPPLMPPVSGSAAIVPGLSVFLN